MFRVFAKQLHPRLEVVRVASEHRSAAAGRCRYQHPHRSPSSSRARWGASTPWGLRKTRPRCVRMFSICRSFSCNRGWYCAMSRSSWARRSIASESGFLFFYFSSVDQNSHMLWGKHDADLLAFYQAVDASIGEVMRRQPAAQLIVMSDHGFSTFDRAVNLNTWLCNRACSAWTAARHRLGAYEGLCGGAEFSLSHGRRS